MILTHSDLCPKLHNRFESVAILISHIMFTLRLIINILHHLLNKQNHKTSYAMALCCSFSHMLCVFVVELLHYITHNAAVQVVASPVGPG